MKQGPRHESRPPRPPARRVAALLGAALLFGGVAPPQTFAQSPNALPALGDSASEDLSVGTEREIGIQIMRIVRRDPAYIRRLLPHVAIAEFSLADLDDAAAEAWLRQIHAGGKAAGSDGPAIFCH